MTPLEAIDQHFRQLRLATVAYIVPEALTLAQQQEWSLESFLVYLLEEEISERKQAEEDLEQLKQELEGQ